MKKKLQAGFTLIELLVVIAIIGVLAAVILASLNSARSKGKVATVKADMANARTQAALYADSNTGVANDSDANALTSGYAGVCGAGVNVKGIASFKTGADAVDGTSSICNDSVLAWAWAIRLGSTPYTYWCADSTGVSRGATASGTLYTGSSGSSTTALPTSLSTYCN